MPPIELTALGAHIERLYTGAIWGEGPVWIPETRSLRWSDIPNDRILEYWSDSQTTTVHREEVEFTNGRTLDRDGLVVQCSHGRRSVESETNGVPHTIVDHFGPHRFNSPNDVVVASDGSIWFTDPPYGITEPREGHPGNQEYGGCFVFRFQPQTGLLAPMITDRLRPNGLAFSPDEGVLYVSDTDHSDGSIWEYDLPGGAATSPLTNPPRLFARPRPGVPDGFCVDRDGRVWTSAADAVHVYSPAGEELLTIPVPEVIANVCFGGVDGNELYITASTSLYRVQTTTSAASSPIVASQ